MAVRRNPMYVNPVMELLNPVVDALLDDESTRLKGVLHDLLIRNHALGGTQDAFVHGGEVFHLIPRRFLRNVEIKSVHPSLADEAEDLRQKRSNVERDKRRLRQALSVVIPKCRTKQEVRDVLPETLVTSIPDFKGMEREREEGFILNDHPRLKAQYQKAVELALYYQANQLIY